MKTLTDELPDLDTELDKYQYESNIKAFKDFVEDKAETTPHYNELEEAGLHPETAAAIITNTIAEFIHLQKMVPQMMGRTRRDKFLRNAYQNIINMMMSYREMLVDCAYDTPEELEELIDDRQHRHRLKFFSDKKP